MFSPSLSPWQCARCTTVNATRAVLCATCERPRLAAAQETPPPVPPSPNTGETPDPTSLTQPLSE